MKRKDIAERIAAAEQARDESVDYTAAVRKYGRKETALPVGNREEGFEREEVVDYMELLRKAKKEGY